MKKNHPSSLQYLPFIRVVKNTAEEDAQMERDEWASREVMPITNWGRRPDGSEIVQYDAPMFFSFT